LKKENKKYSITNSTAKKIKSDPNSVNSNMEKGSI
jgi:hypothetical protein